jgi:hypothetical protein
MDNQKKRQDKYTREALKEGSAKHTHAGVLVNSLADPINAAKAAADVLHAQRRSTCGGLGQPRTDWQKVRAAYRSARKRVTVKVGLKTWAYERLVTKAAA